MRVLFCFVALLLLLNSVLCIRIKCSDATPNVAIKNYCKNGSECYLIDTDNPQYLSISCDCTEAKSESFYFGGPDCSIKIPYYYKAMNTNEVLNTSWLEDLLGLNSWKNELHRVGKICVNPDCS